MDECVCACVFVMILTNEQIVITVLWHVTMSYPYYDSHVRKVLQSAWQNIVLLETLCSIKR